MHSIQTPDEFGKILAERPAVLFYFSTKNCGVCTVLKPKVDEFFRINYPLVELHYVDMEENPELAAQQRIFVAPTVTVYFDGREYARLSRVFGIRELQDRVDRPYNMMFGN